MTFNEKLLEVQKRIKPIKKDAINSHFKNSYADINMVLSELKPILSEIGLCIMQPLGSYEGKPCVTTEVFDVEDGITSKYTSTFLLPEGLDPQKMGAAISYYRRYMIVSLFCLEQEDDDGNTMQGHTPTIPGGVHAENNPIFEDTEYGGKRIYPPTTPANIRNAGVTINGKTVGEMCADCEAAPYVLNPKTNKVFCEAKCWLNPPPIEEPTLETIPF